MLTMMSIKQQQHFKSDILVSREILAVLGVQWDLALQDLQGLLPRQVVQVALDPPFLLAPLGDPVHQPAPEDPSPLADLQTVVTLPNDNASRGEGMLHTFPRYPHYSLPN